MSPAPPSGQQTGEASHYHPGCWRSQADGSGELSVRSQNQNHIQATATVGREHWGDCLHHALFSSSFFFFTVLSFVIINFITVDIIIIIIIISCAITSGNFFGSFWWPLNFFFIFSYFQLDCSPTCIELICLFVCLSFCSCFVSFITLTLMCSVFWCASFCWPFPQRSNVTFFFLSFIYWNMTGLVYNIFFTMKIQLTVSCTSPGLKKVIVSVIFLLLETVSQYHLHITFCQYFISSVECCRDCSYFWSIAEADSRAL